MPSCTVDADFLYVIVIRDYQFVSFISIAQLGIQHFDDDCLCQCCNISGLPVFRLFYKNNYKKINYKIITS